MEKTVLDQLNNFLDLRIESLEDLNKDIPTGFDGGIRELKYIKQMIQEKYKSIESIQHRTIWRAGKFNRLTYDINEEFKMK